MASNLSSMTTVESLNPCCALWQKRYTKIEEKRKALREGVEILKGQIDRLQLENVDLKKAYDEERERLDILEIEKGKETSLRISMEKEIAALKSDISSMKPEVDKGYLDKEVTHLQACLSEREVEINRLKQLLNEEKARAEAGKKAAELEGKNVAELQKCLEYEKIRTDEASKMADAASRKAEDHRVQLETINGKLQETNLKWEELNRKLEAEKQNAVNEKGCSDEAKARAMEQRRIAEANEKRVKEEECRANNLLKQLQEEKQKVENLQKEMEEILSSKISYDPSELGEFKRKLEAEKKKAARDKRHVEEEKARVIEQMKIAEANEKRSLEEKCRADKLLMQLEEEKQKAEKLQREMQEVLASQKSVNFSELDVLKRKLEEEKKKVFQEKKRMEEEKLRVVEQIRIAEANEKRCSEEKCRADKLLIQLAEEKQKGVKMQREMQEVLTSQNSLNVSELDELKRNLEEEKKKAAQEQRHVEAEKLIFMEQIRIAEANKNRSIEENDGADKLLMQLEEEKQKVDKLQLELQERSASSAELSTVKINLEAEKMKVVRERKRADLEISRKEEQKKIAETSIKNALDEKCRADKLSEQLERNIVMIEYLERDLNKVNEMLEAEKKEAAKEKKRAHMEKLKSEELRKFAEANEMRAMEEKCRCDKLLQELKDAKRKLEDMEHELHKVQSCRGLVGTSSMPSAFAVNEQAARVHLLQEQLKFEKKRVKHAKEVAKLEKCRKSILQKELQRLKLEFRCLLDHLSMLSSVFGARNGASNVPKNSSPSQMHFPGDDELRTSCLSLRDASCHLNPNMQFVHAGNCMESTSGMENELDPLQGGSRGGTLPSSALNSNTASFSDEQLMGSQEIVAGSLTMSTGLSAENSNQQATKLRCPNECCKLKKGEKVGIVGGHSTINVVEPATGHANKRRKIFDEFESIKSMNLEGKRIFEEAEKKLFALHNSLLQPVLNEPIEKENFSLPVSKIKLCGNSDCSSKKRKPLHEPEVVLPQAGDSNVLMELDKNCVPSVAETNETSQPLQGLRRDQLKHNQDAVMSFERLMNGDYMKLLNLDDMVAEECFRMAMESPLSPSLPEFDLEVGPQMLTVPMSGSNEAMQEYVIPPQNKNQLYFVSLSGMEDVGSLRRMFCATSTCVAQCLFLQTTWSTQAILGTLLLEKDLTAREKAWVLFSLMLLNYTAVSSSESVNFHIQEQMESFSAHIRTVLFNSDTRDLCAKVCDLRDVLTLAEDFVVNRKIVLNDDVACKLDNCGSCVEILHEGKKIVLLTKEASTNLVVAGSVVLASISKAVGYIGSVCEVSPKILQMGTAEYSVALSILHTFACICGKEYLTNINYSSVMKVVKSVVVFMEGSLGKTDLQHGVDTHCKFSPCVRCPFSEGSVTLDHVSLELLEELQRHIVPQNPAESAHSSDTEALTCFLSDVLSSIELITSLMGWAWACDKVVPELIKILESSHQDSVFTTALVVLLGDIGRLGVEASGYDDTGVEGIKRQLLGVLCQTATSECNSTLPMAVLYGIIRLYPKGHEIFEKGNLELPSEDHSMSASSDIINKYISSLSSEQKTSLAGLVNRNSRPIPVT